MAGPDPELVRRCELAELAADESMMRALSPELQDRLGGGCTRIGDALVIHAGRSEVLMFNRVVGLGVTAPATEAQLDAAIARFEQAGSPRFMVHVAPGARPAELPSWLEARGFYEHNYWICLVRDTAAPEPVETDLRVAPLRPEHSEEAGRIAATAFGYPEGLAPWTAAIVRSDDWRFFGAFDGVELAALAGIRVESGIAWFGFAATRASHRGRRAQSALIARRIAEARALGCRWMAVETAADTPEKPNPSTHNLRRQGFRDAYLRPNWVKVLRSPAA